MRFLIVDTYYLAFLDEFYATHRELSSQPYSVHLQALMDQYFGTSDFYSCHLRELGQEAVEVVPNYEPLQRQWADENDTALDESPRYSVYFRRKIVPWLRRTPRDNWFFTILEAQVKAYCPDILYIQDMHALPSFFLEAVRPFVKKIVGQIASPTAPNADFRAYDLILTSFPHFVSRFRQAGLKSEYFRIGFEPKVLARLTKAASVETAFIGSLSTAHSQRVHFLEEIAAAQPLDFWGTGIEHLAAGSPLHTRYHGTAWGLAMYQALFNAKISLNLHIDAAENHANNMRLYESTGVGTMLLTDAKDDLQTLFEPGEEVVEYHSTAECIELISYYLSHESERQAIAAAGQRRTLREHTYRHRMEELVEMIKQSFMRN